LPSDEIPNWITSPEQFNEFIINANGRHLNIPQQSAAGAGVHIGIIDSAYRLPDDYTEGYRTRELQSNAFISEQYPDTTGHCLKVFNQMKPYSPRATYTFYQAVRDDGHLCLEAFSDSITSAIDDDVDILNISSGDPWRSSTQTNPVVQETTRAIDEGISIVASAGQHDPENQDSKPPVFCPAAHSSVIAVGGLEVYCPAELNAEPDDCADDPIGPYYILRDGDTHDNSPYNVAYCGANGCLGNESCITNQEEKPWERNPLPTGGKPDVLAPMHSLLYTKENGNYRLTHGTSFAAPLVTASIANIFAELREENRSNPAPHEVRTAVRRGGMRIGTSDLLKYDAMGARSPLGLV